MRVGVLFRSQGGSRGSTGGKLTGRFRSVTAPVVNIVEGHLREDGHSLHAHSGGGIRDGSGACARFSRGLLIAKNFCGSILADCFVLTPHNNQLRHCQRNTHRSRRPSPPALPQQRPHCSGTSEEQLNNNQLHLGLVAPGPKRKFS